MKVAMPYPETLPSKRARTVSVINTASALAQSADVTVYSTSDSAEPGEIARYYGVDAGAARFEVARRGLWGIHSNRIFSFFLQHRLKRARPEIIYVRHLKTAEALLRRRIPGARIVFECHEIFSQTTSRAEKRSAIAALEAMVYENVDGLVFINRTLQQAFREHFAKLCPNQIVAYLGGPGRDAFPEKKEWSNLNELHYIGNFLPWKGAETLVRAMPRLPAMTAQLYGDASGTEAARLRSLAQQLGVQTRVCFHGHVPAHEVSNLLSSKARIVVVPNTNSAYSRFTSPLKLFEAMASGNAVVASDIPTIRELTQDGVGAALFEPDSPEDLARCVAAWVDNPATAEAQARAALELSKHYSWQRRAQVLLPFLDEVAVPPGRP